MSFHRRSQAVIHALATGPSTARSSRLIRALRTEAAAASRHFGLTEDQSEFKAVADAFAAKELLPFAAQWDAEKHFPVKTLRNAAELGFGGILVSEDVGEALGCKLATYHLSGQAVFKSYRWQQSWKGRCCSDI